MHSYIKPVADTEQSERGVGHINSEHQFVFYTATKPVADTGDSEGGWGGTGFNLFHSTMLSYIQLYRQPKVDNAWE